VVKCAPGRRSRHGRKELEVVGCNRRGSSVGSRKQQQRNREKVGGLEREGAGNQVERFSNQIAAGMCSEPLPRCAESANVRKQAGRGRGMVKVCRCGGAARKREVCAVWQCTLCKRVCAKETQVRA